MEHWIFCFDTLTVNWFFYLTAYMPQDQQLNYLLQNSILRGLLPLSNWLYVSEEHCKVTS